MKSTFLLIFFACIFSFYIVLSCKSEKSTQPEQSEPVLITITDSEHHLGDNTGSEGMEYSKSFDISESFDSATLFITFLYPNDAGQSGPEIDSPPEIQINNIKVGLYSTDFPDSSDCISQYREYDCDVTIMVDVFDELVVGTNVVKVISKGAAHDGDDDFVFSDLKIELKKNNT